MLANIQHGGSEETLKNEPRNGSVVIIDEVYDGFIGNLDNKVMTSV